MSSSSIIEDILAEQALSVDVAETMPTDLSMYRVVIYGGGLNISSSLDEIRAYVQNGGGYVYLSSAVEFSNLGENYYWLGAQSYGYTGLGENASISVDNPLESGMNPGDLLLQQAADESGLLFVDSLGPGAIELAGYSSSGTFSYAYEFGNGRVYFQANIDHSLAGEEAQTNIRGLLKAGMSWAKTELPLLGSQQDTDLQNSLPNGTQVSTGHQPPSENSVITFANPGPQSQLFPVPSGPTKSIFVSVSSNVVNATLFFESGAEQYLYHVEPESGSLLTFASLIDVTNVMINIQDRLAGDNTTDATATVGYVIQRDAPECTLPSGTLVSGAGSIPEKSLPVGSPGSTPVDSELDIPDPVVPVQSLFIGFDEDNVTGFAISFDSTGLGEYSCPISPAMVEISFDQPLAIWDVRIDNIGPWGIVGYQQSFEDSAAYLRYNYSKVNSLPTGLQIQSNATVPAEIYTTEFSPGQSAVILMPGPASGPISGIWMDSGATLADPHLYFKSGTDWYSTAFAQPDDSGLSGTLLLFADDMAVTKLYVSSDGSLQDEQITIGYVYPIAVSALAGLDQTVKELQLVYLDGTGSSGRPGGLSYSWTQIEGPTVTLQGSDTATASFAAPRVNESGARLSFNLVVTDSKGKQSSDTVRISVQDARPSSPNEPPTIGTIENPAVNEGAQVVLAASAFDSDGDKLSYSWTQKSGPLVTLVGASTNMISFSAPQILQNTTLSFEIMVTDEEGYGVTKTVFVYVRDMPAKDEGGPGILPDNSAPIVSAGPDQVVTEGSFVVLQGRIESTASNSSYDFAWNQVAGAPVMLSNSSSLDPSFSAPEVNEETTLTFEFAMLDGIDVPIRYADRVSIVVRDSVTPIAEGGVKPDVPQVASEPATTSFGVNSEPGIRQVRIVDAFPPIQTYSVTLSMPAASRAPVPAPAADVVGIWVDATGAGLNELMLYFSYLGVQYHVKAPADRASALVFDRAVSLQDVSLNGTGLVGQAVVEVGYYYDGVPLISESMFQPETVTVLRSESDGISPLIEFASSNPVLVSMMAIGIPAGIAVGLKLAGTRKRKDILRTTAGRAAKILFPTSDPVAGEAQKVKPVIEELERMLGTNLETAVSASELLDKFSSGGNRQDDSK